MVLPDATPATDGPQPLWGGADIAAACAQPLAPGATPLQPPKNLGEGIVVADLRDPLGNRLGLIQNPHVDPEAVR
jgi:predicted enzyme related to lactoylglutathione lyase